MISNSLAIKIVPSTFRENDNLTSMHSAYHTAASMLRCSVISLIIESIAPHFFKQKNVLTVGTIPTNTEHKIFTYVMSKN